MSLSYSILLKKVVEENEAYYLARVVELPHCIITSNISYEDSLKEILVVMKEWIESNLSRGLKIPVSEEKKEDKK